MGRSIQCKLDGDRRARAQRRRCNNGETEDIKSTYQEVLNQSLSSLAQSFSARLKREVACTGGHQNAPGEENAAAFLVAIQWAAQTISVYSGGWATPRSLTGRPTDPAKRSPRNPDPRNKIGPPKRYPLRLTPTRSMDLLLDVELPVSISFGRTQLALKDALKLTTGSIVELNRAVSEPVEVIVNNCVIARGQVVVVEGNFGVRIQQIISRQERLRTLK